MTHIHSREATQTVLDPVCGMRFAAEQAAATAEHRGRTYHFCSAMCNESFSADPDRYVEAGQ